MGQTRKYQRLTTETFIQRAREVHGSWYDYSQTEYTTGKSKVIITCPEHGQFQQVANNHLHGSGCQPCGLEKLAFGKVLDNDEVIDRFIAIHGDRYDYSQTEYIGMYDPVTIICPEHGEFQQLAKNHMKGCGCQKCGDRKRIEANKVDSPEFIEKAKKVHGKKYSYDLVEYVNSRTSVVIVCSKHGKFKQRPGNHLTGQGCRSCGQERRRKFSS